MSNDSYNVYPESVEFTHKHYTVEAEKLGESDSYVLYVHVMNSDDPEDNYTGYYDSCGNCFRDDELNLPNEEDTKEIVEKFVATVQEQTKEVHD